MNARMVVLLAIFSALWLFGLIGQVYSGEAAMRYLALSMAILSVGVWRWQPRPALRGRSRERRPPAAGGVRDNSILDYSQRLMRRTIVDPSERRIRTGSLLQVRPSDGAEPTVAVFG